MECVDDASSRVLQPEDDEVEGKEMEQTEKSQETQIVDDGGGDDSTEAVTGKRAEFEERVGEEGGEDREGGATCARDGSIGEGDTPPNFFHETLDMFTETRSITTGTGKIIRGLLNHSYQQVDHWLTSLSPVFRLLFLNHYMIEQMTTTKEKPNADGKLMYKTTGNSNLGTTHLAVLSGRKMMERVCGAGAIVDNNCPTQQPLLGWLFRQSSHATGSEKSIRSEKFEERDVTNSVHSAFRVDHALQTADYVTFLIARGARVGATDAKGKTPLHELCGGQWPKESPSESV